MTKRSTLLLQNLADVSYMYSTFMLICKQKSSRREQNGCRWISICLLFNKIKIVGSRNSIPTTIKCQSSSRCCSSRLSWSTLSSPSTATPTQLTTKQEYRLDLSLVEFDTLYSFVLFLQSSSRCDFCSSRTFQGVARVEACEHFGRTWAFKCPNGGDNKCFDNIEGEHVCCCNTNYCNFKGRNNAHNIQPVLYMIVTVAVVAMYCWCFASFTVKLFCQTWKYLNVSELYIFYFRMNRTQTKSGS